MYRPEPMNEPVDLFKRKIIKQYALHNAKVSRAYNYIKRHFVLRIEVGGEQFLVQANSYPETLEWTAVRLSIIMIVSFPEQLYLLGYYCCFECSVRY